MYQVQNLARQYVGNAVTSFMHGSTIFVRNACLSARDAPLPKVRNAERMNGKHARKGMLAEAERNAVRPEIRAAIGV